MNSKVWNDVNMPGFSKGKTAVQSNQKFVTGVESDENESDVLPEKEVQIISAQWEKGPKGFMYNEQCFVDVKTSYLKETVRAKLSGKLFCIYNKTEEDLGCEVTGFIDNKNGIARLDIKKLFFANMDHYSCWQKDPQTACQYYIKNISHSRGANMIDSPKLDMPVKRPKILFIHDNDGIDDNEFLAAKSYWRSRTDCNPVLVRNIHQILEHLNWSEQDSEHPVIGPWGEVNILAHGNEHSWLIPPYDGWAYNSVTACALENVIENVNSDPDLIISPNRLHAMCDNKTRIILRGCRLGNNQQMLDNVRIIFGGNVTVYAPRYVLRYQSRESTGYTEESFIEHFEVFIKGLVPLNEKTCLKEIQQKYPDTGIDEESWDVILRKRVNVVKNQKFNYTETDIPQRTNSDAVKIAMQTWDNERCRPGNAVDYDWTIKNIKKNDNDITYILEGTRIETYVRRPLMQNGILVVPDLNNLQHFGISRP